jgi:23S rRNA (cytosine1962-C5)-methyltransferase
VSVQEHGLRFLANLHHGQKTGLFLDQRENRATIRRYAGGRRVANLFSYSGAFSVHALAGGAVRAVDVDVAAGALRDAERNAEANGFASRHASLALDLLGDPTAALSHPALAESDLIILDPPSLARHKGQRHAALRAYRRLNAAALAALPAGGLLATASCTAQVGADAFKEVVAEAAQEAGVQARILHEAGHAPDHPVPLAFPEGRYLKFLLLRVDRPR